MRPTPTKAARPTSTTRTPQRRSSPRRGASTAKTNNNAAVVSDSSRSNSSTLKNNGEVGNNRTKKVYGRRARMSPRTHGAAIANSLASPAVDSAFLMSTAAPITPSKRSSAESALHRLARQSKQDRNTTSQLQNRDDGNSNNTLSKRKQRKRAKINYNETTPDSAQRYNEEEEEQMQSKRKSPRKSLPTQFYHALSPGKQTTEDVNNTKAKTKKAMNQNDSKTNKQAKRSPRKSCPTQFYHNLETNEGRKGDDTSEQKTDMHQKNEAKATNQGTREGYKCRKCGQPKKGHTCTAVDEPMEEKDGEKMKEKTPAAGGEESPLLPVSSNTKDNQTKSKRDGKKRRSRGGRQGVSALLSLETLQSSSANKRDTSSSNKESDSAKASRTNESKVGESASSKKVAVATKKKGSMVKDVEKATPQTETMVQMAEEDNVPGDDQPTSPFPSSPLQTSNLECPESGSISVGAQLSPKKKNGAVPEAICIRELMMSCLTEEDKEEEKRRSELKPAEQNDDQEETMDVDAPLPHTPIHTKETPNEAFSPLSMTSPLRANNLLETSYNEDQPEVQDTSLPRVPPRSHNSKRRSAAIQLAQKPSRGSNVLDLELATQTKDDSDKAKQLEMIQAEKQAVKRYQEKMAEFGKLELEARLVTERMRQIEERMKQIETSSITNDLREYDELKRRTSYPYPSEKVRSTKRKIMSSQQHYGYSDDEYYTDEYDSHRNWRHSTHGRHGDRETHIKRQKVRSDSRRSRSPSRTQTKSNSRRRLMEDSTKEYEGPTTQTQRSHKERRPIDDSTTDRHERLSKKRGRKKGSKKRDIGEEGRLSISQMNKTLKSPYAELQADNDETKIRQASEQDVPSGEKVDALDVEEETGTTTATDTNTATSVESTKMPASSKVVDKKESDSSSTKQSVPERADADHPGKATQPNDNSNRPLYWLAGGESDSDEDSWDFDGPMILPPPPA